jgi:hypothetical protein
MIWSALNEDLPVIISQLDENIENGKTHGQG